MPEPDTLTGLVPEGTDGEEAELTAVGLSNDGETLGPDRSGERAVVYWVVFLLLVAGSFLLRDNPYRSSADVHTLVESMATLLAFVVGALALVRFYSRKQATFLLIGTGFLGAGLLDFNHVILTTDLIVARPQGELEDLFAWSWTAERVFLSLWLLWSFVAWRQEVHAGEGEAVHEASVYATTLILTLGNLFFFELVPLTGAHASGLPVSRPAEFLPALFFVLTLAGFLYKGTWRRDAFEHWLVVALIISGMAHIGFISLSEQRFDAMFQAAHLLKIASYLAVLAGLLSSVYATFRREGKVLTALTAANTALEREIDVRAQTEIAVKEGRARLQDFLDNANDLIQSVDPEGRILYVNGAWKQVLGYSNEQLDQMMITEAVHPAHREAFDAEVQRVLDGGEARRFNVEYLDADGKVVILSGSLTAQVVGGRPVACQAILRDVTEQRIAERQLADSQANTSALVESTGDSIWSVDRDHRLITFNSAFALAVEARTSREPIEQQQPGETFAAEDVGWYEEVYQRALSGDRHVAVRSDTVDGQLRYFELYANPIQGGEGITGAVLFGKDVTPRFRAEEALRIAKEEAEAANKAKSDFLASMSHELRTPLNSIIGFTNILIKNRDARLNEKDIGFLERVLSNGKHLLELINEVLDLAKVEAGRMELIIEEVDLGELVAETVGQLEGQAKVKEGDVELIADVPEMVNLVETDSGKLKQVIINLVGNALKFTHSGSVTVRLEMAADGLTPTAIAVQDTGIGIPADRLDAIFEAFQQAEVGTSRKYGGTGLGLALSRSICLLMGYDLMVSSEEGKGSIFSIVMGERAKRPVKAADEPEESAEIESEGETGDHEERTDDEAGGVGASGQPRPSMRDFKVLVVDDEKDSRVVITHYLEEFGCEVVTATDGATGLEAARRHRPDLITLDLMMPGVDGWDALKQLKADPDLRGIPVVVVSVIAGEGRGRLLGAVDLVTKPIEREDLLRVLWRNLARRRGGRVLLVDDDPGALELIGSALSRAGLEVKTASNGQQALSAIAREVPDAVMLDLMMPQMDGVTFLQNLRANPLYRGLPVIVITGKDLTRDEREQLSDLASTVVRKGEHMPDELLDVLRSYFTLEEQPEEAR